MTRQPSSTGRKPRWSKGFTRAGGLVQTQIRKASETRGFAETRLLTHWADIVGPDVAALCRPVKVGYGRGGLGATLTVLTRGAAAPMLQAQLPVIRERVNACYGYNAIARIHVTQTASTGFDDGQTPFSTPAPPVRDLPAELPPEAVRATDDVTDPGLRAALAGLGARIFTKT